MKWKKGLPDKEGWYLWRKTKTMKDPATWRALFFQDESNTRFGTVVTKMVNGVLTVVEEIDWTAWEGGIDVGIPCGGWWAGPIGIPKEEWS